MAFGGYVYGCDNYNCRFCPKINRDGFIESYWTGEQFATPTSADCQNYSLVYCVSCLQCGMQYVGQTTKTLNERMRGHFYDIQHRPGDTTLSRHFNSRGHAKLHHVEIHVLNIVPRRSELRRVEDQWIWRLQTQSPRGLNVR